MIPNKKHILNYTLDELKNQFELIGEKKFRANQVFVWLYKKNALDFAEMSNLSKSLRKKLDAEFVISPLKVNQVATSPTDGTKKYLFESQDGNFVEAVYMQEDDRVTVCISTMVGCPVRCPYCATGMMGFVRPLSTGEILNQFILINKKEEIPVTNVVFMGMGEPFLNYEVSIKTADILNAPYGGGISARKITISTCGIVPAIHRFTKEGHKYKLAVSLNASNDEQRNIMVPVNVKYSLNMLIPSIKKHTSISGQRVTFEYILVKDFNDSATDVQRLKQLLGGFPCKLNIIPYNENSHCAFSAPDEKELNKFIKKLYNAPFTVTVRRSKGLDIAAACGQLYAFKY